MPRQGMFNNNAPRLVAVMGPTGTGKSTFIKLLTKDERIRVGHKIESETMDLKTASCSLSGRVFTLVDTPGFDDSRDGMTDTDILGKIANFLQEGEGRRLDGIIYLHRISDPRMGGTAKKNLRMFRELCGDENMRKVRIVTTYWNFVHETEGTNREADLKNSAFRHLIDAGAQMLRQDREEESARFIMSTFVRGEPPVMLKIQKELNEGRVLGETSAGVVVIEEMAEIKKKHEVEMKALRKEYKEASRENDEDLRAEIAEEVRRVEEMKARLDEDKRKLEMIRIARQAQGRPGEVVPAMGFPSSKATTIDSRSQKMRDDGYSEDLVGSTSRDTTAGEEQTDALMAFQSWIPSLKRRVTHTWAVAKRRRSMSMGPVMEGLAERQDQWNHSNSDDTQVETNSQGGWSKPWSWPKIPQVLRYASGKRY